MYVNIGALPVIVSFKGGRSVVICTDISDKELLHTQVGVGKVVTSGSLGGVIVTALPWNARNVGSFPL